MPIEETLDEKLPDDMNDWPEIEIEIVDDPDEQIADAGQEYDEEDRAPTA